ncbi:nucleotidyltransferase family protein [Epilithonimonas vandammei]|uniref:Nucleotidyltransferase family protein n=1 Tax=Epilithonimonas vandammei TaxID=2487072 RepID=A0A3G8YBG0_9FLAO|nr:sugar phosphate nucleotidyltransferase [Epilithonimonas vandammei]AZI38491.1 nucleotidyltransferase family protein [Epilithonimonas vandammei]
MKAMIFAAGMGTRLQPFTDNHPKALAQVNGVPLLERNIKYLQGYGINDFVINIHHFGGQILAFLAENDNFGANIEISNESDELLETGGGLLFAKRFLENEKTFLIMNVDILTDLNITNFINIHELKGGMVTLAVSDRDSTRKLMFNDKMYLKGWKNLTTNKKTVVGGIFKLRELAFSGVHCVNSEIFTKITRTGKFSIVDEYLDLMKEDIIIGYQHTANLIDVGKPESVAEAEKLFR